MRQSPRFFGRDHGMTTDEVYEKWEELGLIEKKYDDRGFITWEITALGESYGGRKSPNGAPTFDYDDIKELL